MNRMTEKENLLREVDKLHRRNLLAQTVGPDYFEPGMMEYLEQSDAGFDEETGRAVLRFEAKGTRYEGRTEEIEKVQAGDAVVIRRDRENLYNPNNFTLLTAKGRNIGNMPAELCNAIAPLHDAGTLTLESAKVSFVEPLTKRSRHAKQAVLFVELTCQLR